MQGTRPIMVSAIAGKKNSEKNLVDDGSPVFARSRSPEGHSLEWTFIWMPPSQRHFLECCDPSLEWTLHWRPLSPNATFSRLCTTNRPSVRDTELTMWARGGAQQVPGHRRKPSPGPSHSADELQKEQADTESVMTEPRLGEKSKSRNKEKIVGPTRTHSVTGVRISKV